MSKTIKRGKKTLLKSIGNDLLHVVYKIGNTFWFKGDLKAINYGNKKENASPAAADNETMFSDLDLYIIDVWILFWILEFY